MSNHPSSFLFTMFRCSWGMATQFLLCHWNPSKEVSRFSSVVVQGCKSNISTKSVPWDKNLELVWSGIQTQWRCVLKLSIWSHFCGLKICINSSIEKRTDVETIIQFYCSMTQRDWRSSESSCNGHGLGHSGR
jgi:hypothetical protein